jgi:hypothetical protein
MRVRAFQKERGNRPLGGGRNILRAASIAASVCSFSCDTTLTTRAMEEEAITREYKITILQTQQPHVQTIYHE